MNYNNHIIFKCICFVLNHCVSAINLNIVSSFSVFTEFDCVFQSDVLLI